MKKGKKNRRLIGLIASTFMTVIFQMKSFAQTQMIYDPTLYPGYPVVEVVVPVVSDSKDSIPLHLLKKVQSANLPAISWDITPQLFWGEYHPWIQQYPPFDFILTPSLWAVYYLPVCGDSFYENGQLSSRVECVDSVLHGKAFYWDETGHKTSESTYSEGHQIKQKTYDSHGRQTTLNHYDYSGQYHGICIYTDYDSNTKSVSRYNHGVEEGLQEEYHRGLLESKTYFDNGVMTQRSYFYSEGELMNTEIFFNGFVLEGIHFDRDGSVVYHEKRNENNQYEFIRRWSPEGILTEEKIYFEGKPKGEWLVSYTPVTDERQLEYYQNGVLVRFELYKKSILSQEKNYCNGLLKNQVLFFENRDTVSFIEMDSMGNNIHEKFWNESRFVTKEIWKKEDMNGIYLLDSAGFYTVNDTLYCFSIEGEPWQQIEKRKVVWNADTIRQDYISNSSGLTSKPDYFCTNNFVLTDNEFLKQGEWKYYNHNNLDSVITYSAGQRNGRAVYYQAENDSIYLTAYGDYINDRAHGTWTFVGPDNNNYLVSNVETETEFSDSDSLVVTYNQGKREGLFLRYNNKGTLLISGNFTDDFQSGFWFYFNSQGEMVQKINYKNGVPVKKRFDWVS